MNQAAVTAWTPAYNLTTESLSVRPIAGERSALEQVAREFWYFLPGWYFLWCTIDFLYCAMAYFPQKPWHLIPTAVFPLTPALLYFYGRVRMSDLDPAIGRRYFWGIVITSLLLLAAVIFLTPQITLGATPAEHYDGFKLRHEVATLIWVPLIAAHCWWNKGPVMFWAFYLAAFMYGMLQESGGVLMGYFAERGFHLYVPISHAPIVTMFGWSTIYYPAVALFEMYRKAFPTAKKFGPLRAALVVTACAIALDLELDPMATAMGLWTWHNAYYLEPSTIWVWGVPVVNYFAWFWAVSCFAFVYFWLENRPHWSQYRKVWVLVFLTPGIQGLSGLGMFPSMALVEGGFDGPTWRILRAFFEHGPMTR